MEISGTIADTEISLRDVFMLRPGDVIPVTMPEQVTLKVDGVSMFNGRFGVHKGHNAVKVVGRFDARDES